MISDYKEHLHSVHSVTDYVKCFRLTREKLEHEKKRKHFDEVTIDDRDEEHYVSNRVVEKRSNEEEMAIKLVKPFFNKFKLIEESANNINLKNDTNDNTYSDLLNSEEGITKYFMKLKEKIRNFEFTNDMLDEMLHVNKTSEKDYQYQVEDTENVSTKKSRTTEFVQNCDVCRMTFGALSEEQVKSHMELHKTPLLTKIKTETKEEKRFLCPLANCSFWVDKAGMMGGKAAVHLKEDHMIKPKDMVPGQFKFKKISVFVPVPLGEKYGST